MKMWSRKIGSNRTSKVRAVTIASNWCGQGGNAKLTLNTEDGWIILEPESEAETRQLMSAAHIIYRNYQ